MFRKLKFGVSVILPALLAGCATSSDIADGPPDFTVKVHALDKNKFVDCMYLKLMQAEGGALVINVIAEKDTSHIRARMSGDFVGAFLYVYDVEIAAVSPAEFAVSRRSTKSAGGKPMGGRDARAIALSCGI